jgi:transcriptional regulator with XRE-family HTH domain
MDRYKFGEFIYQKRKKKGLTQEEMGRVLGVTNKAISKWEVGETLPDVTMLKPLADLLEVTVDELLSQKELKVEEKKIVKHNMLLLVLVIVLASLELLTIIGFTAHNLYKKYYEEPVVITEENYSDVLSIIPMNNFEVDGQKITIESLCRLDDKYYFKGQTLKINIVYAINYYYYNNDGKLGVVTYYNRIVNFELNDDSKENIASIELVPKTEISNFQGIKNVEIDYEVTLVDGVVYLKK